MPIIVRLPGSIKLKSGTTKLRRSIYRRKLLNNSYNDKSFLLSTIAVAAGLYNADEGNLIRTVERNILEPLKGFGYIHSYKRVKGHGGIKYDIIRKAPKS